MRAAENQVRVLMRKVTAGLFHSVDGVGAMLSGLMPKIDTVIMGRVGYEEWAGYWPKAEQDLDFAGFINNVPKHVASRTLQGPLDWQNSSLIEGELVPYVEKLKQQPGGEIAVMSSISLVRQLLFAGVMDELTLITHPVVAGSGRKLFGPEDATTRLELRRKFLMVYYLVNQFNAPKNSIRSKSWGKI